MPRIRTGDKENAILDAAIQLFSEQGFNQTNMDQISRRAGIAVGTVYLYFKTKEEILSAIFERFLSGYDRELQEALSSPSSPQEKMKRLIETDLETITAAPYRARLFLVELRQSAHCLMLIKERLIARYEEYLRRFYAARPGELKFSLRLSAVLLSGMVENLLYDWVLRDAAPVRPGLIEGILELFTNSTSEIKN